VDPDNALSGWAKVAWTRLRCERWRDAPTTSKPERARRPSASNDCSHAPPGSETQHSTGKERDPTSNSQLCRATYKLQGTPAPARRLSALCHSMSIPWKLSTLQNSLNNPNPNPKQTIHDLSTLNSKYHSHNEPAPCSSTNLSVCSRAPRSLLETLPRHPEYPRLFDRHQRA
jgi:hypothetical protein